MEIRPIVSMGIAYVREITESQEKVEQMVPVINGVVDGKIANEDAINESNNIIGSTAPICKVIQILNISNSPIPPAKEVFTSHIFYGDHPTIVARKKARPWTDEEDMRLVAAIHKYGLNRWGEITNFVGSSRGRAQCFQRWYRGLNPSISRENWDEEEDRRLIQIVNQLGEFCWTKVAKELGNRSDTQCRYHYHQIMSESGKKGKKHQKCQETGKTSQNFSPDVRRVLLPHISDFDISCCRALLRQPVA